MIATRTSFAVTGPAAMTAKGCIGPNRAVLLMPWLARRIGVAILLAWAVASFVFIAIQFVPGDSATPNPGSVAVLHEHRGLARSVVAQYFAKFAHLLTGDFGRSLRNGSPVAGEIGRRLPHTLDLIGLAALFALLVGIPGGLFTAIGRHGAPDRIAIRLSSLALAVPVFAAGTLLLLLSAYTVRWPVGGSLTDDLLPAITLALAPSAIVFHATRGAVLDTIRSDFVRTARAKGLGSARILVHHVLRNALMPVMLALGRHLGTLMSATVLVEYIFNYPGIGRLLVEAVNARDYPAVQGVVLVILLLFVALNLVVDLLVAVLDPRVRAA